MKSTWPDAHPALACDKSNSDWHPTSPLGRGLVRAAMSPWGSRTRETLHCDGRFQSMQTGEKFPDNHWILDGGNEFFRAAAFPASLELLKVCRDGAQFVAYRLGGRLIILLQILKPLHFKFSPGHQIGVHGIFEFAVFGCPDR